MVADQLSQTRRRRWTVFVDGDEVSLWYVGSSRSADYHPSQFVADKSWGLKTMADAVCSKTGLLCIHTQCRGMFARVRLNGSEFGHTGVEV